MLLQDSPPAYVEERLTLEYSGIRFPAVIARPATPQSASAVLLIPGSLFIDVDGNMPFMNSHSHAYADLARQLATRGHTVLRYAKSGPGTGSQVFDTAAAQHHLRFQTRVEVARAALDSLLHHARPRMPAILAGHSEGSVVAGLAAIADSRVAGVISLSGPSVGLLSIMREQLPVPAGAPASAYARFDSAVAALRRGDPLPAWAATEPSTAMMAQIPANGLSYIREVDAVDPQAVYARVTVPVLIVQGGRDPSVRAQHAQALARARRDRPTETAFFPELQHMYKRAADGLDAMQSWALDSESDPDVSAAIDRWVRTLILR